MSFYSLIWKVLLCLPKQVMRGHEGLPTSPVSWLLSDLWPKFLMSLKTSSSPAQQIVHNHTNNNVSQKKTSCTHDTDSCVKLLVHRVILILIDQLNNGSLHLTLSCNVWTSSRSQFVLLKMLKNSHVRWSGCWKRHIYNVTFYQLKMNWGCWFITLFVQDIWQWLGLNNMTKQHRNG